MPYTKLFFEPSLKGFLYFKINVCVDINYAQQFSTGGNLPHRTVSPKIDLTARSMFFFTADRINSEFYLVVVRSYGSCTYQELDCT